MLFVSTVIFKVAFFRLWDTGKIRASSGADVRGAQAGFFLSGFFTLNALKF